MHSPSSSVVPESLPASLVGYLWFRGWQFVIVAIRDLHRRPWGFFGPHVPIPEKNCTQMLGRRKFTGTGMGFIRVPMFPRALRVMGFSVTLAPEYG